MNGSVAFTSPTADAPASAGGAAWSLMEMRDFVLREIGADAAAVAEIRREQAVLEARAVVRLAAAARKADWLARLPGGSLEHSRRSLVAEVATTLRQPEGTVTRRIDEAELLHDSLPATLDALARGDLSYQHAQTVVREARTLPETARAEFETAVLSGASSQTAAQLAVHARRLRERMHPDSIEVRHREARSERGVWVENDHDGMATLVCRLPAASAFAIDDTLDQTARALHHPDETRTHAQLRADCLVDLVLHRDGETTERARGIRANIHVTVPVLTLLGHADEPGELLGYGPIDHDTTRRLAAGAPSFTRILTDPVTGQRLTVGRDHYKVPADLRAAVVLDDETCRFPGCRRRADRCDLDHTTDWAHGGHTSLTNLAALCRRHHTLKHQTHWHVTAGDARTLHWTSPAGVRHTTHPPDHDAPGHHPTDNHPHNYHPTDNHPHKHHPTDDHHPINYHRPSSHLMEPAKRSGAPRRAAALPDDPPF